MPLWDGAECYVCHRLLGDTALNARKAESPDGFVQIKNGVTGTKHHYFCRKCAPNLEVVLPITKTIK